MALSTNIVLFQPVKGININLLAKNSDIISLINGHQLCPFLVKIIYIPWKEFHQFGKYNRFHFGFGKGMRTSIHALNHYKNGKNTSWKETELVQKDGLIAKTQHNVSCVSFEKLEEYYNRKEITVNHCRKRVAKLE